MATDGSGWMGGAQPGGDSVASSGVPRSEEKQCAKILFSIKA